MGVTFQNFFTIKTSLMILLTFKNCPYFFKYYNIIKRKKLNIILKLYSALFYLYLINFKYFIYSKKAFEYLTIPLTFFSPFSFSSNAINASSGTSNGGFISNSLAFLNPNLG